MGSQSVEDPGETIGARNTNSTGMLPPPIPYDIFSRRTEDRLIRIILALSSAVLLLRSLGKWYVKKSITALVLAVLFDVTMIAIITSIGFYWFAVVYNPNFASYFWGDVMGNFACFLICLAITQFKVRMTGPFF